MAIVFFDTETGGVEPSRPTIQLAAVAMDDALRQELGVFEAKIRFDEAACDAKALEINGYKPEAWKEARDEAFVLRDFAAFLKSHATVKMISKAGKAYFIARLAGHNVSSFDCPRLKDAFARYDMFLPGTVYQPLDTYQRALWWFHEHGVRPPENHRLGTLAAHFRLIGPTGPLHDALVDCRLSAALARRLREGV